MTIPTAVLIKITATVCLLSFSYWSIWNLAYKQGAMDMMDVFIQIELNKPQPDTVNCRVQTWI